MFYICNQFNEFFSILGYSLAEFMQGSKIILTIEGSISKHFKTGKTDKQVKLVKPVNQFPRKLGKSGKWMKPVELVKQIKLVKRS